MFESNIDMDKIALSFTDNIAKSPEQEEPRVTEDYDYENRNKEHQFHFIFEKVDKLLEIQETTQSIYSELYEYVKRHNITLRGFISNYTYKAFVLACSKVTHKDGYFDPINITVELYRIHLAIQKNYDIFTQNKSIPHEDIFRYFLETW